MVTFRLTLVSTVVTHLQTNSKRPPEDATENDNDDSTLRSNPTLEDANGSIEEEIDLNADDDATAAPSPAMTNGMSSPQQSSLFASPISDSPALLPEATPAKEESATLPAVVEPKMESAVLSPRTTVVTPPPSKAVPTKAAESNGDNHFIEIKVGEPRKVGDGMKAYVVYKVSTKTNLPYFRRSEMSVNRRFSDFRGLHDKLAEKHLHVGRIIPPAPEKDAVGTAKVKYGKEDVITGDEFIEKRRASLERYLNRTAKHPTLRADPDFREFLELDTELPKATNTSALSGAGVRRLFNRVCTHLSLRLRSKNVATPRLVIRSTK